VSKVGSGAVSIGLQPLFPNSKGQVLYPELEIIRDTVYFNNRKYPCQVAYTYTENPWDCLTDLSFTGVPSVDTEQAVKECQIILT